MRLVLFMRSITYIDNKNFRLKHWVGWLAASPCKVTFSSIVDLQQDWLNFEPQKNDKLWHITVIEMVLSVGKYTDIHQRVVENEMSWKVIFIVMIFWIRGKLVVTVTENFKYMRLNLIYHIRNLFRENYETLVECRKRERWKLISLIAGKV
jgi:hypothetical protein